MNKTKLYFEIEIFTQLCTRRNIICHKMASKRMELPHVVQKFEWDCGFACIQMILLKLGQIFDDSALFGVQQTLGIGECIWTIDLANILRQFDIDFVYYTITCGVDPGYRDEAFYQDDFDAEQARVNTLFEKATEMGINIIKRSVTMADILSKLDEGFIAVVLVDSNLLICNSCAQKYEEEHTNIMTYPWMYPILNNDSKTQQYAGHYVVLCGYDTEAGVVFCKNPSLQDVECSVNIPSFDMARKSYGTDEDIIFINMNCKSV